MAAKKILILTGEIQTGKTTALLNWVKEREDVAGFLTPVKDGKRFFYSIPEAASYPMEAEEGEECFEVGRFKFSISHFQKTNQAVLKCLHEPVWKWIVIDEIGPLELNQQKGFWPSFIQILEGGFSGTIIIVARQSVSDAVAKLFSDRGFETVIISASEFQLFTT